MAGEYESVELVPDETVKQLALAVVLAALTAALAQVSIPIPGLSVPFSLQPFGPLLAGLLLGPLWGGFALVVYLGAGIAGAPVFSNGGAGLGYVYGPTGGFLVGFTVAAVVTGAIAHRQGMPRPQTDIETIPKAAALLAGLLVVYLVGVPWFADVQGISTSAAVSIMAPFAAMDLVKAGIVFQISNSLSMLPGR